MYDARVVVALTRRAVADNPRVALRCLSRAIDGGAVVDAVHDD